VPVISRTSTSVIFGLIDALVDGFAAAVPGVQVYDGYGISDDPGNFVMVGIDDPNSVIGQSGMSRQTFALAAGRSRDEEGEVTCAATCWDGSGDARAARAALSAITVSLETWLRGHDFQGLPTLLWVGYGSETQVLQELTDSGALATVIFRIAFRARI